ncbi:MAG TPA: histidine kinase, partial [Mycobacteriales bacterium]|nr:histidine kinase [Mycobacteriales bacterium]
MVSHGPDTPDVVGSYHRRWMPGRPRRRTVPDMTLPGGIRRGLRWTGTRDAGIDIALMLGVAVVTIAAVSIASEPGDRRVVPTAVGYLIAAAIGAVLLARRRAPLGVLLVSALLLLTYYSLLPGISPALPLSVALYTATVAGRLRWSLSITAFFVSAGVLVRAVHRHAALVPLLTDTAQQAGLLIAVILLGEAVRSRRGWLVEVQRRLERAEDEREQEAARRVAEERLRIARELHDVLAHTISVITVQAGVAADVMEGDEPDARAALATIRTAGREATTELRATLGVLRADTQAADLAPAPGLDQLPDLLDRARGTGLAVAARIGGDPRPLPAAVELTAYRIV